MENQDIKFKTNLNCGGCVSKVKSSLDNTQGILNWNVDTEHADKILTVTADNITAEEIVGIISSKGFKAEVLKP